MSLTFDAVMIDEADNTATLLQAKQAGEAVRVLRPGSADPDVVWAAQDIAFAHKIAVADIPAGTDVIKYGEVIGRAAVSIARGSYVHVHNVESNRARGDKADDDCVRQRSAGAQTTDALVLGAPFADVSDKTFLGWPRADGSAGTRNLVGVLSCVVCANDVVAKLGEIEGVAAFTHQQGCSQTKPDVERVRRVLVNLARNPNLGAVLLVSLGCESVPSQEVLEELKACGKPVRLLVIQQEGGLTKTLEAGRRLLEQMKAEIAADPVEVPISKLRVGLKCGSSDTTQGLSANIVCGRVTEALVAAGCTVVIGETTEFMGAEHIAAAHAKDAAVGRKIIELVDRMEARAKAVGVDMRGGQPTRGNIAGGLTTIEEKSLGALAKAGRAVFQAVIDYGERRDGVAGLMMMDAPGREPEMLTGLAAAGCNLIIFTTGRGAPQGFPFVPVVKVTGNERTWRMMGEHMDCYVGDVMLGKQSFDDAAGTVLGAILDYSRGASTKAEACGYNNSMNIYTTGPTV